MEAKKKCAECNSEHNTADMYKCFYCKNYFCENCAPAHFDRTIDLCSGFRCFPDGKQCDGCPDCRSENDEVFQIGQYYKHSGGLVLHVCGAAQNYIYGAFLIGDDKSGNLIPVGKDKTNFVNWSKITKEEFDSANPPPSLTYLSMGA